MKEKDEFSFSFNHMLLQVILDGQSWLVDVGFGYPSFYLPLKMKVMIPQEQTMGLYRLKIFRQPSVVEFKTNDVSFLGSLQYFAMSA
uniref:arylamine N-acetyltransferase n=1 Tax=Phallusia mammillata TaxID=59560 RepID=A0A6F9DM53_9ASCI|nr:arylamine N-acetyltransferase 2 [Phallusia mammillata]